MSISFSGLASGLDTSSWVESLVALKQAKVTKLEEEKENVLLSQETLNNIKSFFSSFRTMIEKITDAKFGIPSMDLFTQNLANSTNLNIATASATYEAEEASYDILVEKLAGNTEAVSNYSYVTTIVQTTTATLDSKLTEIGLNIDSSGSRIGVNVNGVERGIYLYKNDTIGTLIDKLQNIGVEAGFNETTGVFSLNLNATDINDVDNTGIVSALHLEGVNEGYSSNKLQTERVETVYEAADLNTKLSELGVKAGTVEIESNGQIYNIAINLSTTLGSFLSDLQSCNIEASLNEEGYLTIADAVIKDEGTTDMINALGLSDSVSSKSQKSDSLQYTTVITESVCATSDTTFGELGFNINGNETVVVKNSNDETTTITVNSSTTIDDFITKLTNAGLYAVLDNNGSLEISGGVITDAGSFDVISEFGLNTNPYTAAASGDALTETVTVYKLVTLQTKLVDDLGVTEGYLKVTDTDGNNYYEKIYSGQTISDLMSDFANLGIKTSLDEDTGILTITGGAFETLSDTDVQALVNNGTIRETDSRYIKGTNLLECLYGADTIQTEQISVASTYSKTRALSYAVVNTINASSTSALGNLGLTAGTAVFDVLGESRTINVTASTTVEDLVNLLSNQGISSNWDSDTSRITIENAVLTGGTSNLADVLNLTTTVSSKYTSSDTLYTNETINVSATSDTTLSTLGITTNQTVYINDSTGRIATITVGATTTLGGLINSINNTGKVTASLEDGYIKLTGGYIENTALEDALGLVTNSDGISHVLGTQQTLTEVVNATGETTLGEIISALGTSSAVSSGYNMSFNSQTLSVSATTTLDDLISQIHNLGGSASVDSSGRLSIEGGTVSGTVATALGITSVTHTSSVSASGEMMYTTQDAYADRDTKLSDLGIGNSSYILCDSLGNALKTVSVTSTTTLGAFLDGLKAEGIDGTISNGVIALESAEGKYITGSLATSLGIDIRTSTEVINTMVSSTAAVTRTGTVTADITTTLGQIGAIQNSGDDIKVYNENKECIGTISLTNTSTIGDMFDALKAYDIDASIVNGIISLYSGSGNYIEGNIASNLGIGVTNGVAETLTVGTTMTSTAAVTYTGTETAQKDSKISDFITLNSSNQNITIYNSSNTAVGTITVSNTTTFEDLFAQLAEYDINLDMNDGKISVVSVGDYTAGGGLLSSTSLGVYRTSVTVTKTTGMSMTGDAITYDVTLYATRNDKISDFLDAAKSTQVINVMSSATGSSVAQITVTSSTTFGELIDKAAQYGIELELQDGVLSVRSDEGTHYLANATGSTLIGSGGLGIYSTFTTETTTVSKTMTSSAVITRTTIVSASTEDKISDFINLNDTNRYITIFDSNNTAVSTITVTDTMTYGELFNDKLSPYGINLIMQDGVTYITSVGDYTASGGIMSDLGLSRTTTTVTTTVGTSVTGDAITYDVTLYATRNDKISDFLDAAKSTQVINVMSSATGSSVAQITVTSSTTFGELIDKAAQYGIELELQDGVLSVRSDEGTHYLTNATGSTLIGSGGLGIYSTYTTETTTVSKTMTSADAITYSTTVAATTDDKISDFITLTNSNKYITIFDSNNTAVSTITVTDTMTYGELFTDQLSPYGINLIMQNGVTTIASIGDYTADGGIMSNLGLSRTTTTVTTTVGTDFTGMGINYTTQVTATADTTIGEILGDSSDVDYSRSIDVEYQGSKIDTIYYKSSDTLGEFVDNINEKCLGHVTASFINGVVQITLEEGYSFASIGSPSCILYALYGSEDLYGSMYPGTAVTTVTSTATLTYTEYHTLTDSSELISDYVDITDYDFYGNPADPEYYYVEFFAYTTDLAYSKFSLTLAETTTFGELFNLLDTKGFQTYIQDGKIHVTSPGEYWIESDLFDDLGIRRAQATITKTIGATVTSTAGISYSKETVVVNTVVTTTTSSTTYHFSKTVTRLTQEEAEAQGYTWVTTRAELTAALKNTRTTAKIMLGSDIDLSDGAWQAYYGVFRGTLDGNGYAIKNLTIQSSSNYMNGFIPYMTNATVKNLGFENANVNSGNIINDQCYAVLCPYVEGSTTIDNCYVVNSDINTANGNLFINGTASTSNDISVTNCNFYSNNAIGANSGIIGGISVGTITISGCTVLGCKVEAQYSGGIVSAYQYDSSQYLNISDVTISDCQVFNTGYSSSGHYEGAAGGITGYGGAANFSLSNVIIQNSDFNVTSLATYNNCAGSFFGNLNYGTLTFSGSTSKATNNNISMQPEAGTSGSSGSGIIIGYLGTEETVSLLANVIANPTANDKVTEAVGGGSTGSLMALIEMNPTTVTVTATNSIKHYTNKTTTTQASTEYIDTVMGLATTFAELGLGEGTYITRVRYQGKYYQITITEENTVGDLVTAMAGLGISSFIDEEGKIKFTGTEEGYIQTMHTDLQALFNMTGMIGNNKSYIATTKTIYANTASNTLGHSITSTATGSTTLEQLGASGEGVLSLTYIDDVTTTVHASSVLVTFTSDMTVNDVFTALAGLGFSCTINDGIVSIINNSDKYNLSVCSGDFDIEDIFNLENGIASMDGNWSYSKTICTSDTITLNTIKEMETSATLAELGMRMGDYGTITVNYQGVDYNFEFDASDSTLGDVLTALAGVGVSGYVDAGALCIQCTKDGYITDISQNLINSIFGGFGGSNVFYTTSTETIYGMSQNPTQQTATRTVTMTTSTTLGELGLNSREAIGVVENGIFHNVIVNPDSTIDDMLTSLAGYGISGFVIDGKLLLSGSDGCFIYGISGNLPSILGIGYGNGVSYTEQVTYNYFMDGSKLHTKDDDVVIDGSTLLSDLGYTGSDVITVVNNGTSYNVTVQANDTINDVLTSLAGFGISGSISSDGKLTLTGTEDAYISSIADSIKTALGITSTSFSTTTVDTTYDMLQTPTGQTASRTVTMTTSSTLGELGLSSTAYITVVENNTTHVVTVNSSHTVDDVLTTLAGFGISGSVIDGKLSLTGSDGCYISNMTAALQTVLKIQTGNNNSYTQQVTQNYFMDGSKLHTRDDDVVIDGSTLLSDLGYTGSDVITVVNNGTSYNVTVQANDTINDVLTSLAGLGISGSISSDGKLTLTGTEDAYISSIAAGVRTALGLSAAGNGTTWTTKTSTTYDMDSSNLEHTRTLTTTLNTGSTFSDLGLSGDTYITIVEHGTEHVVTVKPTQTVDDLISTIAGFGISASVIDGKISFNSSTGCYIKGMTNTLKTALKINSDSYSVVTDATWINTDSAIQEYQDSSLKITGDTVLNTISGWNNGNGNLVVHKSDGTFATISVNATGTVDDFFNQIAQYGLVGSISSDGKVTITGIGDVYLQSASGGSNILTALKLGNVIENVKTITVNTTSDTLSQTVTVAASGTTTLGNLENGAGQSITFNAAGNVSLVLETTSDAGNTKVTLTFSKTSSLYDVIDKLAQYGINASIDSAGRFSVSSSSLTDFDISGDLGNFLMGAYNKNYGTSSTTNLSTNLVEKTVVNMNDSTLLSDLGITSGDFLLCNNGNFITLNISNTSTIGDFRALLENQGIITNIIEGKLSLTADGITYLSSVTGGSNIVTKLGLQYNNWTLGEFTQESEFLGDTEVNTVIADPGIKLADLTNNSGINLGVTNGNIYIYQDGTRITFSINTDDTIETLAAKLSQYGISLSMATDGKLYLEGDGNTYLTTDGLTSGASNILSKLNIANNWNTVYDSISTNLDYTESSNTVMNGSTKVTELCDEDGNNLGITTGSFYIYSNGVRNTATITEDTTVNDLMASMAYYGLIADISENGSMSVGAYNDSYMATSDLAGNNSNIVSTLFAEWDFVNVYKSNNLEIPADEVRAINAETKLADINEGAYQAGVITVVKDGVQTNITLTEDDTVGTFMDEIALYGFESVINDKGQLIIKNTGNSYLTSAAGANASNALELLGIENWITTNNYSGAEMEVISTMTAEVAATRDTALSELGVTTGEYYIYNNGVKYTAMVSSDETIGSLMDTLKSFGIECSIVENNGASTLSIIGNGNSYVASSNNTANASNVVEKLFAEANNEIKYTYTGLEEVSELVTYKSDITESTLLSTFDTQAFKAEGKLYITVNGEESIINITADETFASITEKFEALGLNTSVNDGVFTIMSGYDTCSIDWAKTTSGINNTLGLVFVNDLGGFSASNDTVMATTSYVETRTLSVANFADENTKMDMLNISSGTLTVYNNGEKYVINIDSSETFGNLRSRLSAENSDLDLKFEDGILKIYSKSGAQIDVGATTDTSNFSAITGITTDENGVAFAARPMYKVNDSSIVTASGLFRSGDITEGTFIIGNQTINIDSNTTFANIISQINSSEEANATAYWDNIQGKLVIKSRTSGSSYINIEAGTSNFTDILGYTTTEVKDDGSTVNRLNTNIQNIGNNAVFQINGTTYISTSNTITSDISRIKGVTINLKGLSEGETTTITVERDKETLANAVSDIVDAYNELMENVDAQIAAEGQLHDQTMLKLLRNQLRSIMTNSFAGTTMYKNLDAIGIGVASASASNLSTTTKDITFLEFDKDKFIDAYSADQDELKALLVGADGNGGVFGSVETLVESALQSVTGYFDSANSSYTRQISRIDSKITKANKEVERYRTQLEAKFSAMDMLIAKMQQNYSSFLS